MAWRGVGRGCGETLRAVGAAYADPSFEALASRLERLLDNTPMTGQLCARPTGGAMHLELAFFDAALLPSG